MDLKLNPLFNQSLEKGLTVLCAFKGKNRTMTITEIAIACDINKSSAQRMVFTLEQLGYIEKNPITKRYQLTVKTLTPGFNYLFNNTLIDIANPFLSELTNITQETTCLTEFNNNEMVYVARFISSQYIPIHMPIGSRIPLFCTGSGRAYLSALEEQTAKSILEKQNIQKHTVHTETDIEKIVSTLKTARNKGYAINSEELFLGDMTLGAAVIGSDGNPVAAVHVVAPTNRWTIKQAEEKIAPALISCTRALSNAMRTI